MKQSEDCNQSLHRRPATAFPQVVRWWAYLDLNRGPRPYQGRALTN